MKQEDLTRYRPVRIQDGAEVRKREANLHGVDSMFAMFGYTPSDARLCPRIVAGRRCLENSPSRPCVCSIYRDKAFDHARMWQDSKRRHVFTSEPYGIHGEEVVALVSDMAELGLSVRLDARSPWNPGHTILIRITNGEPEDYEWVMEQRAAGASDAPEGVRGG